MTIQLITGTPGAGKSYLAVSLMVDTYFDCIDGVYELKENQKNVLIISNVEGLQLEHIPLDELLDKVGFDTFFTVPYQEKIAKKYPESKIIYFIDESQRFIPPRYKNELVIYYFDYHRHFGHEIFLITQDYKKICKEISVLAEFEYRAVKAMLQSFGYFQYVMKSDGVIFSRKMVKRKKKIFELYTSFQNDTAKTNGYKNRIPLYCLIGVSLCFLLWRITLSTLSAEEPIKKDVNQSQLVNSPGSDRRDLPQVEVINLSNPARPKTVLLRDVMAIYKNGEPQRILFFRCPVTSEMVEPRNIHYKIYVSKNQFYADLAPHDYDFATMVYPSKPKDTKTSPYSSNQTTQQTFFSSGGDRALARETDRMRPTPAFQN